MCAALVASVLTAACEFDIRILERLLAFPYQWMVMVLSPPDVPCRLMQKCAAFLLSCKPESVDVSTAKLVRLWRDDLKQCEISGKLIAMATIGGLLGPVIGGAAYTVNEEFAFFGLALITALVIPLVYVTTKELGQGGQPAQGSVPLKVFIQNPVLFRIGVLVTMTTLATGALEAGVPLFLADNLGLNAAWIGAVLLVMVVAQGLGGWMWGYLVDRNGPVRYMIFGWCLVTISLIAAGYVAHSISDKTLAAYMIIVLLGMFQFAISAAQVPMLPIIDTATSQVYGKGGAGLAFGAFGTAWAAGTIIGPLVIGPVFDYTNSWGITLGILAIPMLAGLIITIFNSQLLHDCYSEEMEKRLESE